MAEVRHLALCRNCGHQIEETDGKLYPWTHVDPNQSQCFRAEPPTTEAPLSPELLRRSLIESFLDDVADFFDGETPISPDSLVVDPRGGEPITARRLLELIRLGK